MQWQVKALIVKVMSRWLVGLANGVQRTIFFCALPVLVDPAGFVNSQRIYLFFARKRACRAEIKAIA